MVLLQYRNIRPEQYAILEEKVLTALLEQGCDIIAQGEDLPPKPQGGIAALVGHEVLDEREYLLRIELRPYGGQGQLDLFSPPAPSIDRLRNVVYDICSGICSEQDEK